MTVPVAARPFVSFPSLLRRHGFAISPDQTIGFVQAVGLLGPRTMEDIRQAALALLAIPVERQSTFDDLFRAFFLGQRIAAPADDEHEDRETKAYEDRGEDAEVAEHEHPDSSGSTAAATERLSGRNFTRLDEIAELARLARLAPARLPQRKSRRLAAAKVGEHFDMRRTLHKALRNDGEALTLASRKRLFRQRRILLIIDVSGSMKERTEWSLRFAHALASIAERLEVFTIGTRLTRITPALVPLDSSRALERVGTLAADIDGGTRLGEALQAFLDIPRFNAFVRGAAVVMLSDGLERGDPAKMINAARSISRAAWRFIWLTPLAEDPDFDPRTHALSHVLPYIDELGDGSGIGSVVDHFIGISRRR